MVRSLAARLRTPLVLPQAEVSLTRLTADLILEVSEEKGEDAAKWTGLEDDEGEEDGGKPALML